MRNPFAAAAALRRSSPAVRIGGIGGGSSCPSPEQDPAVGDWSTRKAIEQGLKASSWVYICVKRLMKAAASVPWVAEELHGKKWEPIETHPLTSCSSGRIRSCRGRS
jgi:phage portal protein BeeE